MARLSITSQIAELEYTIEAMRKWHSHEVNARHIKRDVADLHDKHLEEVLVTLRWFEREEDFIRGAFQLRREAKEAQHAKDSQGVDRSDA